MDYFKEMIDLEIEADAREDVNRQLEAEADAAERDEANRDAPIQPEPTSEELEAMYQDWLTRHPFDSKYARWPSADGAK